MAKNKNKNGAKNSNDFSLYLCVKFSKNFVNEILHILMKYKNCVNGCGYGKL